LAVLTTWSWATVGFVQAAEPLELIPAEHLLSWVGRPFPDAAPPSEDSPPSALATLVDVGTRIAGKPLEAKAQFSLRFLEAFGLMIRYPHALTLIDASAQPIGTDGQGRRVDKLRFAMIVQTGGKSEPFRRVIQKVVNEQTDDQRASLVRKNAHRWSYQELTDKRLPAWCVIAWGDIGENFVLTIGAGVWPLVASVAAGETPGLSRDPWIVTARSKLRSKPLIEIFVPAERICERLDPLVDGRASGFFKAWQAERMDRSHWALGFEDRALYCIAHVRIGKQTVRRVYADPRFRDQRLLATIPPEARYAIYRIPIDTFVSRFVTGLLAVRSPETREGVEKAWAEIQSKYGFDAERDLLAHLGQFVVLHNDPPHPFRIPLAMTILVEIRSEPEHVRKTLETICSAWQAGLDRANEENAVPNPALLQRDTDGVWHLQFGFVVGPAWTVTDRFIISSWSPAALRSYLDKIGEKVGQRAPAP
jgi:hypothetical protein